MARTAKYLSEAQKAWEDKIFRAKDVRKNWKKLFHVDLIREFLDGKQNTEGIPEAEWITVNKLYSHLKAQLPSLYSVAPYFYVKLQRSFHPDPQQIALHEEKAKMRQAFLNYEKEETGLKEKARLT